MPGVVESSVASATKRRAKRKQARSLPPNLVAAIGRTVQVQVVARPRRQRGAITLRRLLLRDAKYRRLARRGDRTLGGTFIGVRYFVGRFQRRCQRRLVPKIGTEFSLRLTTATLYELESIKASVEVVVQEARRAASRGFGFVELSEPEAAIRTVPRSGPSIPKSRGEEMSKAKPTTRVKIRFPDPAAMDAAMAAQGSAKPPVVNHERRFIALELPAGPTGARSASANAVLSQLEREYHVEVEPDFQYSWEDAWADLGLESAADHEAQASLDDVLARIRAREAWADSRGAGVAIAIVDSGIDGRRAEFPPSRRLSQFSFKGANAWADDLGHGTMCACIAAASTTDAASEFEGVAPEAKIISCRTSYFSSEIATIYDFLRREKERLNMPIVANNSWGPFGGTPPVRDNDIENALTEAVAAGIVLVFSAGNNHDLINPRQPCGPNSIWRFKSRANLLSVATCKLDNQMWEYSSRGPGEWVGQADCNDKPDVTAPTPAYGRVLHGSQAKVLINGWGTSGAAPQVSGLAALILSRWPNLDQDGVFDRIRSTAQTLGHPRTCQGAGLINCAAAVR